MSDIYTTADLNAMLAEADAQQKRARRPMSNAMLGGIVPQVSAQDAAINRPEPVERASLFPLATYPDGSTRLALPGMIAEDIPRAFTAPARAYRGEIADDDMIAEGLNFGGTMAMGGSVVPKPSQAAGMFGGRLAKTADHAKLAQAEEMAAKGLPREDIWSQTGWFQGVDGKWRFEIDDSKSVFNAGPRGVETSGLVDKMIDHPAMFDAYPAAGDSVASWTVNPALNGDSGSHKAFNYGADGKPRYSAITVNAKTDAGGRSTALHELQHDIQMREGFARGGSLDEFTTRIGIPFTNSEFRIAQPHKYKRQAGEVEARAVEARRDLTPEQRASRPPWLDYDVPESQQIVRFNANATESAAPGVVMAEASRAPRVRAYHGTNDDFTRFDPARMGSRGLTDEGAFFFGKSPDLANAYADGQFTVPDAVRSDIIARNTTPYGKMRMADINRELEAAAEQTKAGRVIPADIDTSNFGTWNRAGYRWDSDGGARLKQAIDAAKAEGKAGLTINGMEDATGIRDTQYAVWQPGNVYSATTGDLLFENGANAAAPGVIFSEAAKAPRPVQMEVPFFRGSGHAQTSVDYSKPYWGTTDRSTADFYARSMAQAEGATPNVTPAVARFRNPMLVDAQGAGFSEIPFDGKRWSTDDLAAAAKERGHDGLVIDRLYDGGRWNPDDGLPATVAALGPGTVSSAFDPNTILYANSRSSSAPGVLAAEAADKPRGIRAYHGSPHDFDRFDFSKIGTGEGAQAYGHGGYFAENEGVASAYRQNLTRGSGTGEGRGRTNVFTVDGVEVPASKKPVADIAHMMREFNIDPSTPDGADWLSREVGARGLRYDAVAEATELAKRNVQKSTVDGRMYEVSINADPADFLDWDIPLSQQSEKVREGTRQALIDRGIQKSVADYVASSERPAKDAMSALARGEYNTRLNVPHGDLAADASKRLREAGIPGIRYLDQGSRAAGEGSRNYVVFDDALVEILRKYMNPPTAAAPGVLMVEGAKDARQ